MKKHLLNGLLILALMVVSIGTFSSCKDDNEDYQAAVELSIDELEAQLQEQIDALEALLATYNSCDCYKITEEAWNEVLAAIDALNEAIDNKADQEELDSLSSIVSDLLTKYSELQTQVDLIASDVESIKTLLGELTAIDLATLSGMGTFSITIGDTTYTGASISELFQALYNYFYTYCYSLEQRIAALEELLADYESLKEQVETNTTNIANNTERIANLETLIGNIQTTIDDFSSRITALESSLSSLTETVNTLSGKIDDIYDKALETYSWMLETQTLLSNMQTSIDSLWTVLNDLSTTVTNNYNTLYNLIVENVTTLQTQITNLTTKVDSLESALNTQIADLSGRVLYLEDAVTGLQTSVTDLINAVDSLELRTDSLEMRVETLEEELATLSAQVEANTEAIEEIEEEIEALKDGLEALLNRLNMLVTSLIIQGTDNPVFGTFSLPIGIQSNMLITHYGRASVAGTWPSNSSRFEYDSELVFTADDISMLSLTSTFGQLTVDEDDTLMDTDDGNAGTVYMTINPNNVDFTGLTLSLVNSLDEESAMQLKNLQKSDKLLTFGYTKSSDNNGFYEAQATLDPDDISAVKVDIADGLSETVKDLISTGLSSTFSDLASLAQVVYNQFNGILPANALKVSWTADDGTGTETEYAVYSEYALAATAYKPLSFKFYYGQSSPYTLPVITPLSEMSIDLGDISIEIDSLDLSGIVLDLTIVLDTLQVDYDGNVTITLKFPDLNSDGSTTGTTTNITYVLSDTTSAQVIADVIALINNNITGWNYTIAQTIEDAVNQFMNEVMAEVEDLIDSIAAQISDALADLIADINDELDDLINGKISTLNNYISKYNTVAKKINTYLTNPNQYLQVMMCYKGTDGSYHQMSNSSTYPSVAVLDGGDALELFVTTYSAEILASTYKKFVGITNVWKTDDETVSAVNGDATCLSLLKATNSVDLWDQPIYGKTHRVAMSVGTAGYTYEIVYSAMDYAGYTSSRKYYVEIR